MTTRMPGRTLLISAFALASMPVDAQIADPAAGGDGPPPRGQVTAHCYARAEVWQRDGRMPLRLLYANVLYNEMTSGGARRDLGIEWTKFISPRLDAMPKQPGMNNIVYCQYSDSPSDTELAKWPGNAPPPELVEWPGRSFAGPMRTAADAAAAMAVPGAVPAAAPVVAPPQVSMPAAAPLAVAPPPAMAQPAVPASVPAALAPSRAAPTVLTAPSTPHVEDEAAQTQQASAIYDEIKRRDEQRLREEQAKAEAYLRQVQAHEQQMAAAQAAQRQFEERQRQYEAERAAYEAKLKR